MLIHLHRTIRSVAGHWRPWTLAAIAGLAVTLLLAQTQSGLAQPRAVEVINAGSSLAIPGQYIVVFQEAQTAAFVKGGVRDRAAAERSKAAQAEVRRLGGKVLFSYSSALTGFAARLPPEALKAMRQYPGVAWIEADQRVTLDTIQANPPKGLDRTSERLLPLDNRFTYAVTGAGVDVYVIDTGIMAAHSEFGGRALPGFTVINDGNGTSDCHGHGTHVAGTIGGATYGIAKQATLYAVRVFDCAGGSGTTGGIVQAIDWVTLNAVHPAVVNMSLRGGASTAMDTALTNSVAAGVIYAVAAGNDNADACNYSPARAPAAFTVGAIDPTNDTRAGFSNFGTCLDLFAPGVNILSSWWSGVNASNTISGTSMASPHVAGVIALILQTDPTATPATVWTKLHGANNVSTTTGWAGVVNAGGSPNELLHWGSGPPGDGYNDGDPHLKTVDGLRFDFQGAGEYVYLRAPGSWEIQIRQSPVSTVGPLGPDGYHGLTSCVSLNTAVAARVGARRLSFQPAIDGHPDPNGLQLRIDGAVTPWPASGVIPLGGGNTVRRSGSNGMEIDFADGTVFVATSNFWGGPNLWYLNAQVFNTTASEGMMGARAAGSWLPALPNGGSLGAMPATLPQRYNGLYGVFGNAWRVTGASSRFDYRPGTSTATYTNRAWPPRSGSCVIPRSPPPPKPLPLAEAKQVCAVVEDRFARANCTADVAVTGERGFAKLYLESERVRADVLKRLKGDRRDDGDPPKGPNDPAPPGKP